VSSGERRAGRADPLGEATVGLVAPQLVVKAAHRGGVVDHDELGADDLGEVLPHVDADRRRQDGLVGCAGEV